MSPVPCEMPEELAGAGGGEHPAVAHREPKAGRKPAGGRELVEEATGEAEADR